MSTDCINTKIEKALQDKNIVKIMNKASNSFCKRLDPDAIYTCQINALWKAFKNFKQEKNTKFTTYLYSGVVIECIKEIKFIDKSKPCNKKLHDNIVSKSSADKLFLEIMDEIKDENDREILKDKLSNMTINEISQKWNSNRETTRKKLNKVLNRVRQSFSERV